MLDLVSIKFIARTSVGHDNQSKVSMLPRKPLTLEQIKQKGLISFLFHFLRNKASIEEKKVGTKTEPNTRGAKRRLTSQKFITFRWSPLSWKPTWINIDKRLLAYRMAARCDIDRNTIHSAWQSMAVDKLNMLKQCGQKTIQNTLITSRIRIFFPAFSSIQVTESCDKFTKLKC